MFFLLRCFPLGADKSDVEEDDDGDAGDFEPLQRFIEDEPISEEAVDEADISQDRDEAGALVLESDGYCDQDNEVKHRKDAQPAILGGSVAPQTDLMIIDPALRENHNYCGRESHNAVVE